MRVGTKSVLFGAHCFFIHPVFVLIAWWKLYGFPVDPRLWIAFFVHDLGYVGKPNMDGPEGETHVELGAKIMSLFGKRWGDFARYHSRFYARKDGVQYSQLCVADKLAVCLEPAWFYLIRVNLSGEIKEYIRLAGNNSKYKGESLNRDEFMNLDTGTQKGWFKSMTSYMRRWVNEHKDGRPDTWTPAPQKSINNK